MRKQTKCTTMAILILDIIVCFSGVMLTHNNLKSSLKLSNFANILLDAHSGCVDISNSLQFQDFSPDLLYINLSRGLSCRPQVNLEFGLQTCLSEVPYTRVEGLWGALCAWRRFWQIVRIPETNDYYISWNLRKCRSLLCPSRYIQL